VIIRTSDQQIATAPHSSEISLVGRGPGLVSNIHNATGSRASDESGNFKLAPSNLNKLSIDPAATAVPILINVPSLV
jgi:hypothetical protein